VGTVEKCRRAGGKISCIKHCYVFGVCYRGLIAARWLGEKWLFYDVDAGRSQETSCVIIWRCGHHLERGRERDGGVSPQN